MGSRARTGGGLRVRGGRRRGVLWARHRLDLGARPRRSTGGVDTLQVDAREAHERQTGCATLQYAFSTLLVRIVSYIIRVRDKSYMFKYVPSKAAGESLPPNAVVTPGGMQRTTFSTYQLTELEKVRAHLLLDASLTSRVQSSPVHLSVYSVNVATEVETIEAAVALDFTTILNAQWPSNYIICDRNFCSIDI